jgi:hypothetical protein
MKLMRVSTLVREKSDYGHWTYGPDMETFIWGYDRIAHKISHEIFRATIYKLATEIPDFIPIPGTLVFSKNENGV